MTVPRQLRHLEYPPEATIEDIGAAGLQALLDGPDVTAWLPILTAIGREPWGRVAERVERLLPHLESYGTAAAMAAWLSRCRGGLTQRPASLSELRRAAGLTQRDLAQRLRVSQAQVARIERSSNPTLDSLRRYLAALGLAPSAIVASSPHGATAVAVPPPNS